MAQTPLFRHTNTYVATVLYFSQRPLIALKLRAAQSPQIADILCEETMAWERFKKSSHEPENNACAQELGHVVVRGHPTAATVGRLPPFPLPRLGHSGKWLRTERNIELENMMLAQRDKQSQVGTFTANKQNK